MPLKQASFDFDMDPSEEGNETAPLSNELHEDGALIDLQQMDSSHPLSALVVEKKVKKKQRGRMKISEMDAHAESVEIPGDEELFGKRYYPISAVANMFKVNNSLIRYWSNEFSMIRPKVNGKGDRLFRPEDIKNLYIIYQLLREKKYTIDGAKEYLKVAKHTEERFEMAESLKKLKLFLIELKATL